MLRAVIGIGKAKVIFLPLLGTPSFSSVTSLLQRTFTLTRSSTSEEPIQGLGEALGQPSPSGTACQADSRGIQAPLRPPRLILSAACQQAAFTWYFIYLFIYF